MSVKALWLVAFDNVSTIADWLSDAICRTVTGDGAVRRSLYTNSDLVVDAYQRVVLLDGIDLSGLRGDLIDRSMFIELVPIPARQRLTDHDLSTRFRQRRGCILGGLLDLFVGVLAELPDVTLPQLPRMDDFARILAAIDTVTGWSTLDRYERGVATALSEAVDADPGSDGRAHLQWKAATNGQ